MADSTQTDILNARQYNAIGALMVEASVRKACEAAGVPERTMYKWLKDPIFAAEYRAARREATNQAIARIQQASSTAVVVLLTLMARETVPPAVRLGAASKVLDLAIRSVELEDIQARLEALEARYATKP